jgi:hypothetical protein
VISVGALVQISPLLTSSVEKEVVAIFGRVEDEHVFVHGVDDISKKTCGLFKGL